MSRRARHRARLGLGTAATALLTAAASRQVVTEGARTGDLIVKVVNARPAEARTAIDLGGARIAPAARVTTPAAGADAVDTETDTPVTPVTSTFRGVDDAFTYTFPANSVTFPRIERR
ncbi:hypothetical protein SHKM778_64040 [Streptomyces sp. KM77-8]|uniref:Uncharacterized protein n=1 Tax=Streptomyces haneummycinicus TaxID=3074435 RepID=A0AAT9HS52_9ACTN